MVTKQVTEGEGSRNQISNFQWENKVQLLSISAK